MAKKKYSVNWENNEAVSFEIDGVRYTNLDQIKKTSDRKKIMAIMAASDAVDLGAEPEEITPKSFFTMENMVLTGFSIIAAVMLLVSFFSSGSAISTIMKERSAPGQVVDVVVRREYENVQDRIVRDYYYPVVKFTADDGRSRTLQMSTGSSSPDYEKGDEVTVLYDPQHPLDARIKSLGSSAVMWILPVITGILGLSFLIAVLAVLRVMSSEKAGLLG